MAKSGDWVLGTGSAVQGRRGHLVYAMEVSESMTFNEYWDDPRFHQKKAILTGSKKQAFGDNIYRHEDGQWYQLNSHHSYCDGAPNQDNIDNDTQTDRVLVSDQFVYFGGSGPIIPARFRNFDGIDVCARRNYRVNYPKGLESAFMTWIKSINQRGFVGEPLDWRRSP